MKTVGTLGTDAWHPLGALGTVGGSNDSEIHGEGAVCSGGDWAIPRALATCLGHMERLIGLGTGR